MKKSLKMGSWFLLTPLGIVLLGTGLHSQAFPQQKSERWQALIAYNSSEQPPLASQTIALRPNVPQSVFLFLKSPSHKERVKVQLKEMGNSNKGVDVASAVLDEIKPGVITPLKFKPLPTKDKDKEKGGGAKAADGPPFLFQLWIDDGDERIQKLDLSTEILQPHQYVDVSPPRFDKAANRLSLTVRPKQSHEAMDPPCKVELDLNPRVIPGLEKFKAGKVEGQLSAKAGEDKVQMYAQDFVFAQGESPKSGRIYVTVDGYKRAFIFHCDFEEGTLPKLADTRVRINTRRFFPALEDKIETKEGSKFSLELPVEIETDGVDEPGTALNVTFDNPIGSLAGLRQQSLKVMPQADGSLQFDAKVSDWTRSLNTSGLVGMKKLVVQVVGKDGKPRALTDEGLDDALSYFYAREWEENVARLRFDRDENAVFAEVTILKGDKEPEVIRFENRTSRPAPGKTLTLEAKFKDRGEGESPIRKVQFILGDPKKEKGMPAKKDGLYWSGDLAIPPDAKKKVDVTVSVATATGLTTHKSMEIDLSDGSKSGDKEEKSKITGLVKWGDAFQKNATVLLKDQKGNKLDERKTEEKDGTFAFLNVAPGNYRLEVPSDGFFKGASSTAITKEKGEEKKVVITLERVP